MNTPSGNRKAADMDLLECAKHFMRDYVQCIQERQTDREWYWMKRSEAAEVQLISLREECAAKATEIELLKAKIAEAP